MGQMDTSGAFARAFETADCETLIGAIGEWFNKDYRTPDNSLDVIVCLQSAMDAEYTRKEEAARRAWKLGEAEHWKSARQTFDAGMRAFVETLARQPQAEQPYAELAGVTPRHDARTSDNWGANRRPAIGAGWGRPQPSAQRGKWGPPRTAAR